MRPAGFVRLIEITTVHPIQTIMFKNILRTLEAEILEIFKNNELQSQKLDVLIIKKCVSLK